MSNRVINTLTGDLAPVNAELEKLDQNIKDKFDRVPDEGQANALTEVLDANSNRIINLGAPENGNDAARLKDVQVTISVVTGDAEVIADTWDELRSLIPTDDDNKYFRCIERGNAFYTLQPEGYVALAGDVTFANGRVGQLYVALGCQVEWFGAVGDFSFDTLTGTDNRAAIADACSAAVANSHTSRVVFGAGNFLLDTDGGTITIPEGVEFSGVGGVQGRLPTVETVGTKFCIKGVTNSPFQIERGSYVHTFNVDYPFQDEDPVTPVDYPAFIRIASGFNGTKCFFEDITFDRTNRGFILGGATGLTNIHGSFYRNFLRIEDSSSLIQVSHCSTSAVWHVGALTNTKAFQQDNLVLFDIDGGSDGLTITNFVSLSAKVGFLMQNGDVVNYLRLGDFLFDGVMDLIENDTTVAIRNAQFDNGTYRAFNDSGSTFRGVSCIFDGASEASFTDQTIHFSNVRFKVSQTGFIRVNSGVDKLVLSGCSFEGWNQDNSTDVNTSTAIVLNSSDCHITINGGCADNTVIEAARNTDFLNIQSGASATVTGMLIKDVNRFIIVAGAASMTALTATGNTGVNVTTERVLAGTVTRELLNNNF